MADWEARIEQFWETADDADAAGTMARMRELLAERAADDPVALYELASVHDFLGNEREAAPLYRAALDAGLDGARRPQAMVQLASTLRNLGRPRDAIELLRGAELDDATRPGAQAFLALALHDAGEPAEALRVALRALAPTLPLYRNSVTAYAAELR